MRKLLVVAMVMLNAVGCFAQEAPPISAAHAAPIPLERAESAQSQIPAEAQPQTITIPPGTIIPVTLTSVIKLKSTHRGDAVRAVTAFPVTVGTQVAIPAGTFVEGTFDKFPSRNDIGQVPPLVHFTRIVFSNGYTVNITADMTQALAISPVVATVPEEKFTGGPLVDFQPEPAAQLQTPPPPPKPNFGAIIGAAVAGFVAVAVISIIAIHHRGSYDGVAYDIGSQFNIVLDTPLTLDAARVATAISPAQ
jgi:hypothetical protein